jgi:hypothetical protein
MLRCQDAIAAPLFCLLHPVASLVGLVSPPSRNLFSPLRSSALFFFSSRFVVREFWEFTSPLCHGIGNMSLMRGKLVISPRSPMSRALLSLIQRLHPCLVLAVVWFEVDAVASPSSCSLPAVRISSLGSYSLSRQTLSSPRSSSVLSFLFFTFCGQGILGVYFTFVPWDW